MSLVREQVLLTVMCRLISEGRVHDAPERMHGWKLDPLVAEVRHQVAHHHNGTTPPDAGEVRTLLEVNVELFEVHMQPSLESEPRPCVYRMACSLEEAMTRLRCIGVNDNAPTAWERLLDGGLDVS